MPPQRKTEICLAKEKRYKHTAGHSGCQWRGQTSSRRYKREEHTQCSLVLLQYHCSIQEYLVLNKTGRETSEIGKPIDETSTTSQQRLYIILYHCISV